jgi:hypothetical protein
LTPARGIIFLPFSTIKITAFALSHPFNVYRAVPLTPEQFHYAFTNALREEQTLTAYTQAARINWATSHPVPADRTAASRTSRIREEAAS